MTTSHSGDTTGGGNLAFSLVIPCYNESAGLPELVRRCAYVAAEGGGEIVLVDNGSTDDSAAVLEGLLGPAGDTAGRDGVRWVRVPVNQGYGFGITSGLAAARADIVGWTHADLQTDPADVLRALPLFEGAGERVLVKGRRFGRPVADRVFTAGMSTFETALLRRPLRDINAQPTLFSRELLDRWGEPPTDFSLDLFALYSAQELGFEIRRFPVIFAPRKWGSSSWNTDWSAKRRFIRRTLDYSLQLRKSL
ncbi:glycosyltransferase family 2 protein [Blastococcus sp. CT_GayMR16]|uniref:glycosyltransferase family 2 protein n=1 Tax=Blastococcus sp. CT_GayMR16 TaxID=2559607 RepID=UPI00107366F4|nr:glycosyltransferase family 2 protein [Blastococcus sp. CT_GayMR16]TFV87785.1 glycosyltransferase family 2 protein [Blastococcus sp. CT_GayMR16]